VIPSTQDRLRVFVSSTIKECAAERGAVRDAIRSINHEPVLFEDVGARPYPPREVYKARLEIAQIFVGIYRESYGWVAPDMAFSGVEDEFRLAQARGMDRLVYVFETPSARDPRLQALIDEAKNAGITLASYRDPEQLKDRVRDDLTAVISNRFVEQAVAYRDAPTPDDVLDSLVPNPTHRLRRPAVERSLIERLNQYGRIVVTAPIGGGKTVMLAQMSAENAWIFVDGQGLNRLDLLARATNAIRQRLQRSPITLPTEQAAIQELLKNWNDLPDVTLVVDGTSEPAFVWRIPAADRRLILASRSALEVPSHSRFDIPPLSSEEIASWITTLRGEKPSPSELATLVTRSGGSPLYLRFFALGVGAPADLSLRELEIRAVQSLPPRAKEITSYLTLSERRFSMSDLQALVEMDEGPEAVAEQVAAAGGVVRQTRGHVSLVHEHLRATLLEQLHQAPARLTFFATRLGRYFEQSGHYLAAFHVYLEAGEPRHRDRVLDRAANQAALMGGGAPALPVFRRLAELCEEAGKHEERLHALLSLAFALKQTGGREEAASALNQARLIAETLSDPSRLLRVKEMEAVLDLGNRPRSERITELEVLRNSYSQQDDRFNAARTGTLLTAEYISAGNYRSAETVSREVLEAFEQIGDEYGLRIARLNLAAALSGISGREEEAAAIAQELQQQLDPEEYPRERAVLCNYLTRHYRESGDPARAAEFALEAISIGEQLGDRHVIAINRTTLGNCRRDEERLDDALIEYHIAEQTAASAGLRDAESAANELIASVHNQREQYHIALQHAQHAAATARMVGDHLLIARAEEERAIALEGQRETEGAVGAYISAAKAIAAIRPGGSFFVSLVNDGLRLCVSSKRIRLKIRLLSEVFSQDQAPTAEDDIHPLHALYNALPQMTTTVVRVDRALPMVALSMADLLADVPPLVERRIILQAIDALLPRDAGAPSKSTLGSVAAILLAHSGISLTLGDVADIAERIALPSTGIYFKPQSDGAGQWTVRLEIADGVVISIVQLDDNPRTAATTTILALLLASLDDVIRRRLLDGERIPRSEAIINVASRTEFETQIGSDLLNLGDMPKGFAVAESTDVTRTDQPPILVLCGSDFPMPWRPDQHALSDVHMLLGEVLRVLVAHLLAQSVEPEVLYPKIGSVVRRIGYEGPTLRAHPRE
jgi:tetratricopeptide (TPR) repeat protein